MSFGKLKVLTLPRFALVPLLAAALIMMLPWLASADDPRVIEDFEDLIVFANDVKTAATGGNNADIDAVLSADIDATSIDWLPIGADSGAGGYTGTFDGAGHTIELKNENVPGTFGLFRRVNEGGTIKNLVVSVDFKTGTTSSPRGAGLVSSLNGGNIEHVTLYGSIINGQYVGGLVNSIIGGAPRISNCVNNVNISSTNQGKTYSGGIVSYVYAAATDAVIEYCANHGNMTSNVTGDTIGGLVGNIATNAKLTISNSYNAGAVSRPLYPSVSRMGGLVGGGALTVIQNSFNYGTVKAGEGDANGAAISGSGVTEEQANGSLFYLDGSGLNTGGGATAKSAEEFKDGTLVALLNAGPGGRDGDGDGLWEQGVDFSILKSLGERPAPPDTEPVDNGENDPAFVISSASDLLEFAREVRNRKTRLDAVLTADIDASSDEWTAIASSNGYETYNGTFDGQGHSIKLRTNDDAYESGGKAFFRWIGQYGAVVSLDLDVDFKGRGDIGGVAVTNHGRIEGVTVRGSVRSYNDSSSSERAGGIVITNSNSGTISRSANHASVYSGYKAGGIAASNSGTMEYCANYGPVTGKGHGVSGVSTLYVGGLAGGVGSAVIRESYNAGEVRAELYAVNHDYPGLIYVGGLSGNRLDCVVENSFNYGTVKYNSNVGYAVTGGEQRDISAGKYRGVYYLEGSGTHGADSFNDNYNANVHAKTADDFAGGAVLALLNGEDAGEDAAWVQGAKYPVLREFYVDETVPALTAGTAERLSATEAAVTFTGNEAGAYYYAIAISGAEAPDIDTNGEGTALTADEEVTITLDGLETAGAYDIRIIAKDAAGNTSGPLVITIPAYVSAPPTEPENPGGPGEPEKPGVGTKPEIVTLPEAAKDKIEDTMIEVVTPPAITEDSPRELLDEMKRIGLLPDDESEADDTAPPAPAKFVDGELMANPEALLEAVAALSGEESPGVVDEVIPLSILSADVTAHEATAAIPLSMPLGKFDDGLNAVGDIVMPKLKDDGGAVMLERVSISKLAHGKYAIIDEEGDDISPNEPIDGGKVYTFVIGIMDDSDLDWNKRDRVIGDPLGVGLARSDSGASDSGSGGCSAGATGVLAALAVLAAAFRARRKGR
ncbi:MAG: hypothetical protein LBS75_03550 [Synergistaceae bacterium]|nr:hypothetical protein [Synergistaceae bacterium]